MNCRALKELQKSLIKSDIYELVPARMWTNKYIEKKKSEKNSSTKICTRLLQKIGTKKKFAVYGLQNTGINPEQYILLDMDLYVIEKYYENILWNHKKHM
eukprot:187375_1